MRETTPNLRAIILTGDSSVGYDAAMESGRRGARQFVLKNQLDTLPEKVRQILREPVVAPIVFLSYDMRDEEVVKRFYSRLKKHGLKAWMDMADMEAGTKVESALQKHIQESDHFIFCHSRHSRIKEGLLRKELNLALARLPEFLDDRHHLIVARLDESEVIDALRGFHYVDLFQRGGFDNLLRVISGDAVSRKRGNT